MIELELSGAKTVFGCTGIDRNFLVIVLCRNKLFDPILSSAAENVVKNIVYLEESIGNRPKRGRQNLELNVLNESSC